MKRFIKKTALFGAILAAVVGVYAALDPFKVIRLYDDYSNDLFSLNKELLGVRFYEKGLAEYGYDSFILGSSRSFFWRVGDWERHLPAGSSPFHFGTSAEQVDGVVQKLRYIEKSGARIKNVLWPIDYAVLEPTLNRDEILLVRHPKIAGGWLNHHIVFLSAALNPGFLMSVLDHKITGAERPYMSMYLTIGRHNLDRNVLVPRYNEYLKPEIDSLSDEEYYTPERLAVFESTHKDVSEPLRDDDRRVKDLREIKAIFDRQGTDYRIVISPLWHRRPKIHRADMELLREIFGAEHIYDFSGWEEVTTDYRNYYEDSHYRPHVARMVMDSIYRL